MQAIVALLASAWIEIAFEPYGCQFLFVALLASAWIEIGCERREAQGLHGRTPRECVD